MARAMAAALADIEAPSAAEVYQRLRQSFPLAPLSACRGPRRHHGSPAPRLLNLPKVIFSTPRPGHLRS
jgi:hypothetical protein